MPDASDDRWTTQCLAHLTDKQRLNMEQWAVDKLIPREHAMVVYHVIRMAVRELSFTDLLPGRSNEACKNAFR
jgi:hypothetical protein